MDKIDENIQEEVEDTSSNPLDNVESGFNLDDFVKEAKETPKQDYTEQLEQSTPVEHHDNDDTHNGEGPKEGANTEAQNRKQAERLVKISDRLLSFGISLFAMEEDSTMFRAKEHELKDIIEDATEMMTDSGSSFRVPPWLALVLGILLAYMPALANARKMRKKNKAAEAKKQREAQVKNRPEVVPVDRRQPAETFEDVEEVVEKKKVRKCERCDEPLKPTQKKYCSNICKMKKLNDK